MTDNINPLQFPELNWNDREEIKDWYDALGVKLKTLEARHKEIIKSIIPYSPCHNLILEDHCIWANITLLKEIIREENEKPQVSHR